MFGKELSRKGAGVRGALPGQKASDVLGDDVRLDVDPVAWAEGVQIGIAPGVGDYRHLEAVVVEGGNGKADTVHRDRAANDHVLQELRACAESKPNRFTLWDGGDKATDAVHMPLDEMAAQLVAHAEGWLEVHERTWRKLAQSGPLTGLRSGVSLEAIGQHTSDGKAYTADGHAGPFGELGDEFGSRYDYGSPGA